MILRRAGLLNFDVVLLSVTRNSGYFDTLLEGMQLVE